LKRGRRVWKRAITSFFFVVYAKTLLFESYIKTPFVKKLILATIVLMAVACSSSKHSATPSGTQSAPANSTQDGSSAEKAVVIREKNETDGVAAEYTWVRKRYPGCQNKSQALTSINGKSYDVLKIVTVDGVEKDVYFDISKFFGKF
jgi:hypothetical protein